MRIHSCFFYVVFFSFFLSAYHTTAKPTEDIPNARTLYKQETDRLYKRAWIRTFLPIPIISTVMQSPKKWKAYRSCKKIYGYFKSAYVLHETTDSTPKQIKKAKKRLKNLLETLQEETRVKRELINPLEKNIQAQSALNKRIYAMTIEELASLLNKADKVIPSSLGDPRFDFVRHDVGNFMFSLRTIDANDSTKSIFEKSVEREEELMKDTQKSL